ncbi:MAG: glycoside hydrolase family 13 protein [Clostridiales bacterium]|nr:glycoside hydrolase family 13 protein [Clostridiales bacterium]
MDIEQYMDFQRVQQYISHMRPMFDKRALFSDETRQYRIPEEPEAGDVVTIRFRTLKNNVDAVFFISGARREQMTLTETKNGFDYYSINIELGQETIHYYFEIRSGKITCFYNELGVTRDLQEQYSFGIVPGFKTPDWAKGAVMYQIFVDRFCNGDTSNDVLSGEYFYINAQSTRVTDWSRLPENMDVNNFYGGDLQGVMDKLDYLQELGVEVIYLNPIFVSPSNHKYDIQDYDYVDPHYGRIVDDEGELLLPGDSDNTHASRYIRRVTGKKNLEASNQLLIELVEEIHKRGMKIILDGVFNHCGSFNKWLDRERIYENQEDYEKGAYIDPSSPYHTFFKFNNEHDWPYNEFYDGWWGHDTLPKLNYEDSPKLQEYIMHIARKWVSPPYNVDGWRLDVAADLGHSPGYNHLFWKEFRRVVKEANPEAVIIAEHYGDASSWLKGDEWDTVMNYDAFMEPVSWFLTGMEKHSDQYRTDMKGNAESFRDAMLYNNARFFAPSLQVAMNELDNHDHSRFLTRTNGRVGRVAQLGHRAAEENVNKAVLREAVVMQMTWPGAPTLYYGDEAGVCGFTDPDNRRTYPWGREDQTLLRFYRTAIAMHKSHQVLKTGSLKFLKEEYNLIAYARFSDEERIVVIVNNNNANITTEIPVWEAGIPRTVNSEMTQILDSNAVGFSVEKKIHPVEAGVLTMELSPLEAVVLYSREEETE